MDRREKANRKKGEPNIELARQDWIQVNEAIKQIYDIADERALRRTIMNAIFSLIPYDFGDFCYASYDGLIPTITDPVVKTRFSKAFQEEYEAAYQRDYGQMDYTKWCLSSKESIAFRESDIIDDEVRKKTRFFSEFLQPRNLIHSMGCYLINKEAGFKPCAIALYRDATQQDFSVRDLEIMKLLLPHMEQSMVLCFSRQPQKTSELSNIDLYLMNTHGLTRREAAVAKEVEKGLTNAEIADVLNISVFTVKKHISNILSKTDVSSRIKLMGLIRTYIK